MDNQDDLHTYLNNHLAGGSGGHLSNGVKVANNSSTNAG